MLPLKPGGSSRLDHGLLWGWPGPLRRDQGTCCWPVPTSDLPLISSLQQLELFDGWGHRGTQQQEGTCGKPQRSWSQDVSRHCRQSPAPTATAPHGDPITSVTMGPGKRPLVAQTHAGGSVGRGGFPSTRFHLNNLQVGGSHVPNFTLPVTDGLLLKC